MFKVPVFSFEEIFVLPATTYIFSYINATMLGSCLVSYNNECHVDVSESAPYDFILFVSRSLELAPFLSLSLHENTLNLLC